MKKKKKMKKEEEKLIALQAFVLIIYVHKLRNSWDNNLSESYFKQGGKSL